MDSILNRGGIKSIRKLGFSCYPACICLPISSDLGFALIPYFQVGNINLISDIDAGTVTDPDGQKFFQYRYILIPGVVPGRLATVDWNNYDAVKKYLGLKD